MKQMPYKTPDGFFELSRMRNRAAVHRAAAGSATKRHKAGARWAISIAATTACLAIGIIGYWQMNENGDTMAQLIAQMEHAPEDVIYEMSADEVYYPEDINLL